MRLVCEPRDREDPPSPSLPPRRCNAVIHKFLWNARAHRRFMRRFIFDTARRIENTPIARGEKNFSAGTPRFFTLDSRVPSCFSLDRKKKKKTGNEFLLINKKMSKNSDCRHYNYKQKYFARKNCNTHLKSGFFSPFS